jgi:proline dehydrogenase
VVRCRSRAVIDRELGLCHAREIAEASAPLGTALMISAEGSDRADLVLDLYEAIATDYPHVGITLQARLHRTPDDLERVLALPGTGSTDGTGHR